MLRLSILSILFTLLFASCKDFEDFNPHTKFILKSEEMMFRGIQFDKDKGAIKEAEQVAPEEEFPDYVRYLLSFEDNKDYTLDLEYFFNNDNRLDMIIAYYSLKTEEEQSLVFDELTREFTKRFGPGEEDELGWYTWKFKDQIGVPGQIEIILNTEKNDENGLGIDVELVKYYDFEQNMSLESERAG